MTDDQTCPMCGDDKPCTVMTESCQHPKLRVAPPPSVAAPEPPATGLPELPRHIVEDLYEFGKVTLSSAELNELRRAALAAPLHVEIDGNIISSHHPPSGQLGRFEMFDYPDGPEADAAVFSRPRWVAAVGARPAPELNERERFEKWAEREGFRLEPRGAMYRDETTDEAWRAWKARGVDARPDTQANPSLCNHWPGQPRCEICGMGATQASTPNAPDAQAFRLLWPTWPEQLEQKYLNAPDTPPCPECHIQPGETCDICGKSEPDRDLDPENAKAAARSALGYSQAFDGKGIDWQNDEPWPHRMELAQALDWITDLGAMVLNLADRVAAPDTQAPSEPARRLEILRIERDHARARLDRSVKILAGIHALLYPPRFTTADGKTWSFKSPIVEEQMQALSDAIRAIPDAVAALAAPSEPALRSVLMREFHARKCRAGELSEFANVVAWGDVEIAIDRALAAPSETTASVDARVREAIDTADDALAGALNYIRWRAGSARCSTGFDDEATVLADCDKARAALAALPSPDSGHPISPISPPSSGGQKSSGA